MDNTTQSSMWQDHDGSSMLEAALEYVRRGLFVFPVHTPTLSGCSCGKANCDSVGKHPRIKHWQHQATTDPEQIRQWWTQWPDTNIGLTTGQSSGFVALDIDGPAGEQIVRDRKLPETFTVLTPRGHHQYFRYPEGGVPNRVNLAKNIDLRGDGGFVVAAPSLHASGQRYQILNPSTALAEIPTDLLEWIRTGGLPNEDPADGAEDSIFDDGIIPEGKRNDTLTRLVGRWLGRGLSHSEVAMFAHQVNRTRCQPPLPDDDVDRIVQSIGTREAGKSMVADVVRLSEVEAEKVQWLWIGRIPLGKVTVLDGQPGRAKSTLLIKVAADVTTGCALPGGQEMPPSNVLIIACEDGVADTIKPRLIAAGGDPTRCFVLSGVYDEHGEPDMLSLPRDLATLEQVMREHSIALVIMDPLLNHVQANIDAHKDQQIRRVMGGLARVAASTGAAVVVVRHLNKGQAGSALQRGMGSIGIAGVARSVMLAEFSPDDSSVLVLAPVKLNIAKMPPSLTYRVVDADGVGRVEWISTTDYTADALIQQVIDKEDPPSEVDAFLQNFLAGGPQTKAAVMQAAKDQGIVVSDRTLRRRLLKLKGSLTVGGKYGVWGLFHKGTLDQADQGVQPVQTDQPDHGSHWSGGPNGQSGQAGQEGQGEQAQPPLSNALGSDTALGHPEAEQ